MRLLVRDAYGLFLVCFYAGMIHQIVRFIIGHTAVSPVDQVASRSLSQLDFRGLKQRAKELSCCFASLRHGRGGQLRLLARVERGSSGESLFKFRGQI